MRKWSELLVAIAALAFASAGSGSAVPVGGAKMPERLMESPVVQVKGCKKGYYLKCDLVCDKYGHSDYCEEEKNKSSPLCCKHYKKVCKCAPAVE
jgi:hypothetical protein